MSEGEEQWKYINSHWDEYTFFQSKLAWSFVLSEMTPNNAALRCPSCNMGWNDDFHINAKLGCCANCDWLWQPFLSNPRNEGLVLKYIDPKYHKYILFNYDWKTEYAAVLQELKKKKRG